MGNVLISTISRAPRPFYTPFHHVFIYTPLYPKLHPKNSKFQVNCATIVDYPIPKCSLMASLTNAYYANYMAIAGQPADVRIHLQCDQQGYFQAHQCIQGEWSWRQGILERGLLHRERVEIIIKRSFPAISFQYSLSHPWPSLFILPACNNIQNNITLFLAQPI